ncbi:MAG: UbiA family prenyltransferase [Chitinispirillaceae bacterium]|jgi:4-hydroxybenzoate polyprenyltransferase
MILLLLKTMRPHQWVKNLLLFAPFVLAHQIRSGEKYPILLIIFTCMCLTASATYLINDLFDRKADRRHPDKKNRSIASGALSPIVAWCAAGIMFFASLAAAARLVGTLPAALLACYAALSLLYTVALKRLLMVDVIVLSFFYSLRIIIGGVAVSVAISPWFLAFSFFFFLSLAFVKRYTELRLLGAGAGEMLSRRGYGPPDAELLPIAGISSGLLSILVFLLYIATSEQVKTLYSNSLWLWMIAPLFVYWLMRTWFLAVRGVVHSDPVTFAIKDPPSWITAVFIGILLLLGSVT